jgi:hypothetical protein
MKGTQMETSSNLIQLRDDDHFGLCPKCHRQGGNYHANRKDHWSVCKKHKLKWPTGSGLLSFPFTHDTGEFSWQAGEEVLKLNRFFSGRMSNRGAVRLAETKKGSVSAIQRADNKPRWRAA